jgi:hypothetical protein
LPKLFSKNALLDKSDADKVQRMKARLHFQKLAPMNSEGRKLTNSEKIRKLLAELNKEIKSEYNFS